MIMKSLNHVEHDSLPSIINILDQKLANSNGDHLSYTLSKYGLSGLTETLARSLAPHIRVNAIAPGKFLTRVFRHICLFLCPSTFQI